MSERILSTTDLPDWYEKLKETFNDAELKFEGGESSLEAMNRIVNVVDDVCKSEIENTLIVTHGNIMSLLLKILIVTLTLNVGGIFVIQMFFNYA